MVVETCVGRFMLGYRYRAVVVSLDVIRTNGKKSLITLRGRLNELLNHSLCNKANKF